jgi:repressor of nif and glnA expression
MKIKKTSRVQIEITADEITDLVKSHLEKKGFIVQNMSFNIKTEYEDCLDHLGTEVVSGMSITANTKIEEDEID